MGTHDKAVAGMWMHVLGSSSVLSDLELLPWDTKVNTGLKPVALVDPVRATPLGGLHHSGHLLRLWADKLLIIFWKILIGLQNTGYGQGTHQHYFSRWQAKLIYFLL